MIDKTIFECAYPDFQEKRIDSTFWNDFTIADAFGLNAIKDTFNRAFNEWKSNYKMLTELIMVLNHKLWEKYNNKEMEAANLYNSLWSKADSYAVNNLKGEELEFFTMVTD